MHRLILSVIAIVAVSSCSVQEIKQPYRSGENDFWDVLVNHRAVTMATVAPFDTITLTATPRNYLGHKIVIEGTVSYWSGDKALKVDSTGMVKALGVVTTAWVFASYSYGGMTHTDSVLFKVTAGAPSIEAGLLSLELAPGDSAKHAVGVPDGIFGTTPSDKRPAVSLISTLNTKMTGFPIRYSTSDSTIMRVNQTTGAMRGLRPDSRAYLRAEATVYGKELKDSIEYYIGYPLMYHIGTSWKAPVGTGQFAGNWAPAFDIIVGTGAVVVWHAEGALKSFNVKFDRTEGIGASELHCILFQDCTFGDIPLIPQQEELIDITVSPPEINLVSGVRARQFNQSGDFQFHSDSLEGRATISVR